MKVFAKLKPIIKKNCIVILLILLLIPISMNIRADKEKQEQELLTIEKLAEQAEFKFGEYTVNKDIILIQKDEQLKLYNEEKNIVIQNIYYEDSIIRVGENLTPAESNPLNIIEGSKEWGYGYLYRCEITYEDGSKQNTYFQVQRELDYPKITKAQVNSDGSISLEWDGVNGANEYEIYSIKNEETTGISNSKLRKIEATNHNAAIIQLKNLPYSSELMVLAKNTENRAISNLSKPVKINNITKEFDETIVKNYTSTIYSIKQALPMTIEHQCLDGITRVNLVSYKEAKLNSDDKQLTNVNMFGTYLSLKLSDELSLDEKLVDWLKDREQVEINNKEKFDALYNIEISNDLDAEAIEKHEDILHWETNPLRIKANNQLEYVIAACIRKSATIIRIWNIDIFTPYNIDEIIDSVQKARIQNSTYWAKEITIENQGISIKYSEDINEANQFKSWVNSLAKVSGWENLKFKQSRQISVHDTKNKKEYTYIDYSSYNNTKDIKVLPINNYEDFYIEIMRLSDEDRIAYEMSEELEREKILILLQEALTENSNDNVKNRLIVYGNTIIFNGGT